MDLNAFGDPQGGPLGVRLGDAVSEHMGGGVHAVEFRATDAGMRNLSLVRCLKMKGQEAEQRDYIRRLREELPRLASIRHPRVARLISHSCDARYLYVCHERPEVGSLQDVLAEFGPLDGFRLHRVTAGVLEGLAYLHGRSPPIAHRDLNGASVLLDTALQPKLSGYAWPHVSQSSATVVALASLRWTAPEVVRGGAGEPLAADVWSFGCVLVQMVSAERPWGDETGLDDIRAALLGHRAPGAPAGASAPTRDLLQRCFRAPGARATAAELLASHMLAAQGA